MSLLNAFYIKLFSRPTFTPSCRRKRQIHFCRPFRTYVTRHVESQSGFRTRKIRQNYGRTSYAQRWIENLPNKEWWKLDANLTGGELFHLIHELDLLCWLLGDIEAVFAQAANQAHHDTPDSRDVLQLLLRFKNGVLGSLEMGTAYRLHQWGIQIHGENGVIEVNFFTSSVTFNYLDGKIEHVDLFDEFEADLSLRESAKGTQQYNVTHAPCQLWLSRAAEIEVQSVVEHLTQGKISPLSLCLTEAIEVAEAAKQSMVTENKSQ